MLSRRNDFTFSGGDIDCEIIPDKNGVDWFAGFRMYDERGKREIRTKHPETVRRLVKAKASLSFQIKQWAESRADGTLPLLLFSQRLANEKYPHLNVYAYGQVSDIETELQLPEWVVNAVETQKVRFY